MLGNATFGLCYAWSATRFSWGPSVVLGFAGYFIIVALLYFWTPSFYIAVPVVLAGLLAVPRLYPRTGIADHAAMAPANDLLLRMGTGVSLVLLVTHFSSTMGPELSGALAMFPMMAPVLGPSALPFSGPP